MSIELLILIIILILLIVGIILILMMNRKSNNGIRIAGSGRSVLEKTPLGYMVKGLVPPAQQGDCNSCWAISTAQTISDRLHLMGMIPQDDELNYYMLHDWTINETSIQDGCQYGALITAGMEQSMNKGVPLMSTTRDRSFDDRYISSDLDAPRVKVDNWRTIPLSQAQREIATNGPVVAIINLYDSFDRYRTGVYSPLPRERADPNMVHMVSIVGYDDDGNWIMRNSYGTRWGMGGYFKVKKYDPSIFAENVVYIPEI